MKKILSFMKRHWGLTLSVIYLLSPIDFIPDFLIWILGPAVIIDDGFILLLAIVHAIWKDRSHHNHQLQ